MKNFYLLLCLVLPLLSFAQKNKPYELKELSTGTKTSLRGLSIVDNNVAWVSGSAGYVGKTTDGGKNWQWQQVPGYEKVDFRDIEAFDDQKAIILGIASPAYILITKDGGKTWKEVYKNTDSLIFLDGMDFWNEKEGIAYGDPINNKMQLLKTTDGGESWQNISNNLTVPLAIDEASFAASGTTIRTAKGGKAWIATGGSKARVYYTSNYGQTWQVFDCPILQGEAGAGIFSVAFYDAKTGIVVGGNYKRDKENTNNVLLTTNGGKTWTKPQKPVAGFRSAVEYITKKLCYATGTSGTDVSLDGGTTWNNFSTLSFNCLRKAKKGTLVLLAGDKGKIYQLNN